MPTILDIFGLRFQIYVRDHMPPHVHVISQDGSAKFEVSEDNVRLMENKRMKPHDLKLAEAIVIKNAIHILNEWVKIHG